MADKQGRTPAQAAAGKAPVEALAELLRLRPQDVLGDGAAAKKAKKAHASREGSAKSLLEKVEITAVASSVADGEAKPKRARRSL